MRWKILWKFCTYLADPVHSKGRPLPNTMLAPPSDHNWYLRVSLRRMYKTAIERLNSILFPLNYLRSWFVCVFVVVDDTVSYCKPFCIIDLGEFDSMWFRCCFFLYVVISVESIWFWFSSTFVTIYRSWRHLQTSGLSLHEQWNNNVTFDWLTNGLCSFLYISLDCHWVQFRC